MNKLKTTHNEEQQNVANGTDLTNVGQNALFLLGREDNQSLTSDELFNFSIDWMFKQWLELLLQEKS